MIGTLTRQDGTTAKQITFTLGSNRMLVGRDSGCHIAINDRSVSRIHAAIIRNERGHYTVEDQDSRNGTLVNGIPVQQKRLRDRDQVSFGDMTFDFNLIDPGEEGIQENSDYRPAGKSILKQAVEQTIIKPPTGTSGPANSAAEAWQIVRFLAHTHPDQLHDAIDHVVDDLAAMVGIRHVLLYLPFSANGSSRFVRRGERASRYFLEERLHQAMSANQPVGIQGSRVITSFPWTTTSLDALYLPISLADDLRACLYADATDDLNSAAIDALRFAAEALGIGISLHRRTNGLTTVEPEESSTPADTEIIGRSPLLMQVMRQAIKASATDYPVLIRGETGTGKELLSRLIHQRSSRSKGAHVAVNCGGGAETLLMSDLFGHEKGAFTGAVGLRKGHFEMAAGGTIFLDEIGEAPPAMQSALLRVLQEGTITRLGSSREIKVDVRIVAATNRDLEKAVESGAFRRDLMHRLNTVELHMPALRERKEDIPSLIQHVIQRECRALRRANVELAPAALDRMTLYSWPGNIRELENAVKWAVTMAEENTIQPEDLPRNLTAATPPIQTPQAPGDEAPTERLSDMERRHILHIVSTSATKTDAARRLGIGRNTLYAKLQEYGIDTEG